MEKNLTTLILVALSVSLILVSCANQMTTRESSIYQEEEVNNCRIIEELTVRAGTGDNAGEITRLNKNEEVRVLEELRNWYVVMLDDGRVGVIDSSQASPIVKEGQKTETSPPASQPEGPEDNTPAPVEPVHNLSSLEKQMVELVNSERSSRGLDAYKTDPELNRLARMKAEDMVENDYFSHYSPTYGSPFDMMKKHGIEYLQAGENIAANSSVQEAHNSLMSSRGHRENILSTDYTNIGVGVKSSDRYGYIFVQMFTGKPQ